MDTPKQGRGRPSLYRPEYCQQLREYANRLREESLTLTDDGRLNPKAMFPTLSGFAVSIGVGRTTLTYWANDNPDFSDAMEYFISVQDEVLSNNGLKGLYHAGFAGLVAKNLIGWKDKQDIEHSGPGRGPLQIQAIRRIIIDPEKGE